MTTSTVKHVPNVNEIPNKLQIEILELKNKQTTHSTLFPNPVGHFTEEIYLKPQFFRDPLTGNWETINNALKTYDKDPYFVSNTANEFLFLFANAVNVEKELTQAFQSQVIKQLK